MCKIVEFKRPGTPPRPLQLCTCPYCGTDFDRTGWTVLSFTCDNGKHIPLAAPAEPAPVSKQELFDEVDDLESAAAHLTGALRELEPYRNQDGILVIMSRLAESRESLMTHVARAKRRRKRT